MGRDGEVSSEKSIQQLAQKTRKIQIRYTLVLFTEWPLVRSVCIHFFSPARLVKCMPLKGLRDGNFLLSETQ